MIIPDGSQKRLEREKVYIDQMAVCRVCFVVVYQAGGMGTALRRPDEPKTHHAHISFQRDFRRVIFLEGGLHCLLSASATLN
eukprot:6642910-Pyramimonas_sp.AAC.2